MSPLVRDAVRYVIGGRRAPLAATLVLALGLGTGATMFALLDRALLQQLPYPHSDRLVQIWATDLRLGIHEQNLSLAEFRRIAARTQSFENIAFHSYWAPSIDAAGQRSQIEVARVSGPLFDVLGVAPAVGTGPIDGSQPQIVLSHRLAERLFGSAASLPSAVVVLDGLAYAPSAIMPAGFSYPAEADAWVSESRVSRGRADARDGFVVGRLAPGVEMEEAETELARFGNSLGASDPEWTPERGLRAVALQQQVGAPVRKVVLLLFAAVSVFFLIACASAGQLLYVENLARRREWAVRKALGASSRAVIGQLVLESALIAAAATALGVLVATWSIDASKTLIPAGVPRLPEAGMTTRVVMFMAGLGALSTIALGLLSARRHGRAALVEALRDEPGSGGRAQTVTRAVLLGAGTASLVVLTFAAVSLAMSLWRLTRTDLGFSAVGVSTVRACAPPAEASPASFQRMFGELGDMPLLGTVAMTDRLPTSGDVSYEILIEGIDGYPEVGVQSVTAGYFDALGIPILAGAAFDDRDTVRAGSPKVALVNEAFRDRFWPGVSPVGKRFMAAVGDEPEWVTVVGMTGNVRASASAEIRRPQLFFSFFQQAHACASLLIRPDRAISPPVLRMALWNGASRFSLSDVTSLETILYRQLWQPRLRATLTTGFAALALIFGAVALYATLSQMVLARRKDLAVRAALGARRGDLARAVLAAHAAPVAIGIALGTAAAFALTSWTRAAVYGFERLDGPTALAGLAVLGVTVIAATAVPALRAEQVDLLPRLRNS